MGRNRQGQKTDEVTETPSSSTAKERSSGGRGQSPQQMTGSSDLKLRSSSRTFKVTIHQLDDLSLSKIFGKLDTKSRACVARVCKRWQGLVDSPALWKHTTVHLNPCSLTSAHLDSLKRRGIRRVMVTTCQFDKKFRMLIYGLSSLVSLCIHHIKVSKQGLRNAFPEALPSLKKLILVLDTLDFEGMEYIACIFQNLSDLMVYVLCGQELTNVPDQPTKMPCLTSLRICGMSLDDKMLQYLSQACPNLQQLSGVLSRNVTDDGMQQFAQLEEIQRLNLRFHVFPSLSSTLTVKLQNLHILKFGWSDVGDEQLDALAHLPELEELEMGCRNISGEGWRALGHGFRKLKCLVLHRVHFSEDAEVESFGFLLSLEKIAFESLRATDLQMKSLCCALNHVHSMTIMHGPETNHDYMKDIADMKNLKEFSLHETPIGDEELEQLANGRAPLKNLAVISCGVHDKSLLLIAQKKSLKKLELNQEIKVAKLSKIVKKLPDLHELKTNVSAATKLRLQRLNPRLIVSCFSSTTHTAQFLAILDFLS